MASREHLRSLMLLLSFSFLSTAFAITVEELKRLRSPDEAERMSTLFLSVYSFRVLILSMPGTRSQLYLRKAFLFYDVPFTASLPAFHIHFGTLPILFLEFALLTMFEMLLFLAEQSKKDKRRELKRELERELKQHIISQASLITKLGSQQNSDAASNSISSASNFSRLEICDPPIGDGGSASVLVGSNGVTEDEDDDHDGNRNLSAVKEDDNDNHDGDRDLSAVKEDDDDNHDGDRDLSAVKEEDDDDSIPETTDFSRWEKGESIGAGGYGAVYVARNRETRALCAVKELKDIHKLGNIESIRKEIKILSQLEHTNIVKYYGHEIVGSHISLYMEYIQPGSLKKYILEQGVLHEHLIRNFTAQILSGLVYLHSKRVVHRDIKPGNLLVDSNNIVKLVDFGLAKHLAESIGNHSRLGTPYYAAPEVLENKEYNSSREAYAADIWSLGCVIIEMFSREHPWPGFEPVQVIFNVHFKQQHPPIPEKLCEEGKDFLELCFTRTPADRPSAAALLDHPFVKPQTASLADDSTSTLNQFM